MNMLSAREIYKLAEELTLPAIIRDCLLRGIWGEDDRMLIASLMHDMRRDQLLLSLACSLRIIADTKADEPEITRPLIYHADTMLDDYAPHWRLKSESVFPSEWALHVTEDLEYLHELLLLTRDAFAYRDDVIYNLCEIMALHLNDHLQSDLSYTYESQDLDLPIETSSALPSNVILFPLARLNSSAPNHSL